MKLATILLTSPLVSIILLSSSNTTELVKEPVAFLIVWAMFALAYIGVCLQFIK
jgi:hypothetical protein